MDCYTAILQHVAHLTIAVDNSAQPEDSQSFVARLMKEAGVLIMG